MATRQVSTLAVGALAVAMLIPAPAECVAVAATRHFGPFGVARGQIARLNFANAGIILPCVAELRFIDGAGRLVASAHHTLAAGETAFLDVDVTPPPEPEAEGRPSRWRRKTLRAVVEFTPPPDPDAPAPTCVATLEIFDAGTGRTHVLLGGPDTVPAGIER
jgi:hypothetical protein